MSTPHPASPDESAAPVQVGDILVDKYRVERVLGAGGMGLVVAATHLQLEEPVAIKVMLPEAARSSEAGQRFLREARASAKIKSEHVARVTDVGTLPSGAPYMVMEHLTGRDLADALAADGPLSPALAAEYVLQACEALAEAHAAGIVHRDLKPPNLFLTHRADGSPCIKVLDFGISKFTTSKASDLKTKTSAVMGSPLYMSPEQLRSARDVDARSDIWGLGAVLYELLTGIPPFDAETIPQLLLMILEAETPPLSRPDVPPALEAVVRRCLEKDRDRRYQHVGELAEALAPFVGARGRMSAERVVEVARQRGLGSSPNLAVAAQTAHGAVTPVPAPKPAQSDPTFAATDLAAPGLAATGQGAATQGSWTGAAAPRKRPVLPIAAGAVLLLAGAALGLALVRGGEEPAAGPAAAEPPASAGAATPAGKPAQGSRAVQGLGLLPAGEAAEPAAPAETAAPAASASAAPAASAERPAATTRPATTATRPPRSGPTGTSKSGDDAFNDRK